MKRKQKAKRTWTPPLCKRAEGLKFDDRRTKRNRTRGTRNLKAIKEYE